jgi:hypothetical protein
VTAGPAMTIRYRYAVELESYEVAAARDALEHDIPLLQSIIREREDKLRAGLPLAAASGSQVGTEVLPSPAWGWTNPDFPWDATT